jgi:hypothetical protein
MPMNTMNIKNTRSSALPTAGGGKKCKTISAFAALASDSEEELATLRPTLAALNENDPYRQAMSSGSSWGDLALAEEGDTPPMRLISPVEWAQRELADLAQQEAEIWNQPFAQTLSVYYADSYDTRALTEDEYDACMTWLYEKGWSVSSEDRNGFKATPDNLPPRVWIAQSRFDCCDHVEKPVPMPMQPHRMKKIGMVPRFCRASCGGVACADTACRYVHDDTICRINEPCNFGAGCGASDAAKRALCIRMHPGETWAADMVVHRPAPAPVA